ncbi:MAG TPA: hypothetical protein VHZ24_14975 [Pirellulales bacterium]|jgi:ABC-type amino acid transport substrate-binding protein|nr:hypothetical protein [Pirellulales bacterium]
MMRTLLITALIVFIAARAAGAQAPTTVQLPTFHFFTVQTTVSVPDRGTMLLGGSGSLGTGNLANGPIFLPTQSSRGSAGGATMMSVRATIHDFEAMDAALLAGKVDMSPPPSIAAPGTSVVEARQQRQVEVAATDREAAEYYSRAVAAERDGKPGAAKVWYQMASRRATGTLKAEIEARLAALLKAPPRQAARP